MEFSWWEFCCFSFLFIPLSIWSTGWSLSSASPFHIQTFFLSTSSVAVLINSVTKFYDCKLRKESHNPYDFRVYWSTLGNVLGFPGVCKMKPYCRWRQWEVGSWWAGELPTVHMKKGPGSSSCYDETHTAWFLTCKTIKIIPISCYQKTAMRNSQVIDK